MSYEPSEIPHAQQPQSAAGTGQPPAGAQPGAPGDGQPGPYSGDYSAPGAYQAPGDHQSAGPYPPPSTYQAPGDHQSAGPYPPPSTYQAPGGHQSAGAYPPPGAYQAPAPYGGQQAPYGYPPAAYGIPSAAQQASQTSLVLGIIGLFTFGIILGPLAIMKASEAERGGVDATAGKVVGWITTILHGLALLTVLISVLGLFSLFAAVAN